MNRIDPYVGPSSDPEPPPGKIITAKVFAIFASAWPRHEVTEPTLNMWAHQIGHMSEAVAMETATTIVRTSEWWPSIAKFIEVANGVSMRRSRRENVAALPEPRDLDMARTKVAEIRSKLHDRVAVPEENQP